MQVWARNKNNPGYDLSNLHVLVVEDNKHMQRLIKEILRSFNVGSVQVAEDGASGFKTFQTMQPDLVISDWSMAPMDGLEMVDQIRRATDSVDPFAPVIMVTGNTEYHRVKEAIDHGINEFLAKPISALSLYARICKVIENPRKFVRAGQYIGPDRRRSNASSQYEGPARRIDDSNDVDAATASAHMKQATHEPQMAAAG